MKSVYDSPVADTTESTSLMGEWAVWYAEKGLGIFPVWEAVRTAEGMVCACPQGAACKSMGKHPRLASGFKGASNNVEKVKAWWRASPDANIGMPTGLNHIAVIDADGAKGVATLEERGYDRNAPRVKTGSGRHAYFEDPEGRVPSLTKELGIGIDTRGVGGYVILPPSVHASGSVYEWEVPLDNAPLPGLPSWLLEELTAYEEKKARAWTAEKVPRPETPIIPDDKELLEKARRASKGMGARFAGLFDHGDISGHESHSHADWELLGGLCYWTGGDADRMVTLFEQSALYRPPGPGCKKDAGYVRGSVKRLLRKYTGQYHDPVGNASRAREAVETRLVPRAGLEDWKGVAGATDHAVYMALLHAGGEHGRLRKGGVEVSIDQRTLTEKAGVARKTTRNSLRRMEERGLIERKAGVKGKSRGSTLVLFAPEEVEKYFVQSEPPPPRDPKGYTRSKGEEESTDSPLSYTYGVAVWRYFSGDEVNLLRLRNGTPLNKSLGSLLAVLLRDPDRAHSLTDLASDLGRRKDSVKRSVARLLDTGLVEEVDEGSYRVHPDFDYLQALEDAGIIHAEERQRARHEAEREYWRLVKSGVVEAPLSKTADV